MRRKSKAYKENCLISDHSFLLRAWAQVGILDTCDTNHNFPILRPEVQNNYIWQPWQLLLLRRKLKLIKVLLTPHSHPARFFKMITNICLCVCVWVCVCVCVCVSVCLSVCLLCGCFKIIFFFLPLLSLSLSVSATLPTPFPSSK